MPDKVAIYIRVSTREQAEEGYSIEQQTERLTAYCKARDWHIHDIYKDPGFSGSNTQRPALQRMFSDIKAGFIDCVLVYKLDRLSRSQKDTLYMIEDVFGANGVAFVSMQENFDTSSPFGRAMIGILSVFAQLEREQIRERMAMGREARAKEGYFHGGGWRPFGYDYVDGLLKVNPAEAEAVREVYRLFLDGTPVTSIVRMLERRFARPLNHSLVHSILSTPLYKGYISWEGKLYKGKHEPIVDEITFAQAGRLLKDRARIAASKPNPFKPTTLLGGGLLVCANCGAGYIAKGNYSGHGAKKTFRPYYTCYSRAKSNKRRIIDPACRNPSYAVVELDARILAEVRHVITDENYFQSILHRERKDDNVRIEEDRRALMLRIDELDAQLSRIIDLYQLGTIGIDDIGRRTQKLQSEKETLQHTLDALVPMEDNRLTEEEARSKLATFETTMSDYDLDAKRSLLHSIIQRIIVLPTPGELEIVWNF